ncbi:unnamed protein product [Anisakis simplex]|uniref:UPF0202 protein (inferred by orthology to a C. elegans protein) n=1 Tax=Anisakis simplex TaxID=6269 RepID=A0A0M3JJX5_ANISI|nr:unnamed protein product [Anisakis simplex]
MFIIRIFLQLVKLSQAELVVIDEAAAIPLPVVKELISGMLVLPLLLLYGCPYMVFLASTINGYEGTGRSLSLKLLQQLREQSAGITSSDKSGSVMSGFKGAFGISSFIYFISLIRIFIHSLVNIHLFIKYWKYFRLYCEF